MINEDLFIEGYKLPRRLSKEETLELFSNFNEENRNKLIEHNVRLILNEISDRFRNFKYDKKDLVSVGTIGLVNAVDTFDISKGFEFSTYATRCIDNEILKFINKTSCQEVSFEEVVVEDDDYEDSIKLESVLSDKTDFREEIDKKELYAYIRVLIDKLNERDRKIVMLYFGFNSDRCYNTTEISKIMKISKTYVGRILNRTVEKLGTILDNKGLIELNSKQNFNQEKSEVELIEIRTIYDFFNNYTEDEVNFMVSKLTHDEYNLLILKYGNDLHHPHYINLSRTDSNKFYKYLIPRMKEILINSFGTRIRSEGKCISSEGKKTKKDSSKMTSRQRKGKSKEQPKEQSKEKSKEQPKEYLANNSNEKLDNKQIIVSPEKPNIQQEEITKKDSIKLFDLFKIPSIYNIASILTIKEAIIISLKLGYVDGKCFSNNQIATSLGISEEEVRETIKKIVLLYKENIKERLDGLLEETTIQEGNTIVLNKNNKDEL